MMSFLINSCIMKISVFNRRGEEHVSLVNGDFIMGFSCGICIYIIQKSPLSQDRSRFNGVWRSHDCLLRNIFSYLWFNGDIKRRSLGFFFCLLNNLILNIRWDLLISNKFHIKIASSLSHRT